jgi:hypothetical protein
MVPAVMSTRAPIMMIMDTMFGIGQAAKSASKIRSKDMSALAMMDELLLSLPAL